MFILLDMPVFISTATEHSHCCIYVRVVCLIVCDVQVRYSVIENSESCISINFENVPVAKLHDIRPR